MSELSANSTGFVTRTVNGKEVKFSKWTPRQRQTKLNQLKAARKDQRRANLKEAGLPPDQIYSELDDFDDKVWDSGKFLDYVNTPEGYEDVVRQAWEKAGNSGDFEAVVVAVEAEDETLLRLACELCNYKFGPKESPTPDDAEGTGPNPMAPGTHYGA